MGSRNGHKDQKQVSLCRIELIDIYIYIERDNTNTRPKVISRVDNVYVRISIAYFLCDADCERKNQKPEFRRDEIQSSLFGRLVFE